MTTGNVYTYRMPAGIPGAANRQLNSTSEPNVISSTNTPVAYGDPVKMGSDGRIQALVATDTIAAVYGFLERPFPTQDRVWGPGNEGFGVTAPVAGHSCTVIRRGYVSVTLQGTTVPAKNGPVFVRLASPPTGGRVNGLEAAADATAGNTFQLTTAQFMGAADASGNTEIAYNL